MRTRLTTDQRRQQLLAIGAKLFAQRPYEDVRIEEVAEIAGVSRGLMYHYFATKREFLAAIVEVERDRLLQVTGPKPGLSLADQLAANLDVYLDYAREHPDGFRFVQRAYNANDDAIRRVRDESLARQRERLVAGVATMMTVTPAVELAVSAWLAFTSEAIVKWLDDPVVEQSELREMCARTLFAAVGLSGEPSGRPSGTP